jgi:branched-chain amino acid transport system permease protein
VLRNVSAITKGMQGLNPLPAPSVLGYVFTNQNYVPWYYLFLALLGACLLLCSNLLRSRIGRRWLSVRDDELAARSMGIPAAQVKLSAFAVGSCLCAMGGALWASLNGNSIDPDYYDFRQSVVVLCIIIIGGLGSIRGVVLGALVMVGFNNILLPRLSESISRHGYDGGGNVLMSPNNWKYLVFGVALVLMMRLRPAGLLPAQLDNPAPPPGGPPRASSPP